MCFDKFEIAVIFIVIGILVAAALFKVSTERGMLYMEGKPVCAGKLKIVRGYHYRYTFTCNDGTVIRNLTNFEVK